METIKKTGRWIGFVFLVVTGFTVPCDAQQDIAVKAETFPENHGRVNTRLYMGDGEKQPLLVGFGGAEGGNAWTSDRWKPQRDRFLAQGYAFLAVAYFGEAGIPAKVDRIALEGVYAAITEVAKNPKINRKCIAVIGGSKGAELALLLGSQYPDIKAVVGIVAGSAVFPAHTDTMDTPSFSRNGRPFPFVPVPESAVPFLRKRDLRGAWDEMVKDKEAMERAAIPVEKINGPIFLLSATQDEYWPSDKMSEAMIARLKQLGFKHSAEHIAIEGNHGAPLKHLTLIEESLRNNFLSENSKDCPR
jgi:dienelactone hydrolase